MFEDTNLLAFTAFFVAPTIIATSRHNIELDPQEGPPIMFILSTLQSYIPSGRAFEEGKYFKLKLLHAGEVTPQVHPKIHMQSSKQKSLPFLRL